MIIIGGTGKIGSHLVRHFSARESIIFTFYSNKEFARQLSEQTGARSLKIDFESLDPQVLSGLNPEVHRTAVFSAGIFMKGSVPGFYEIEKGIRTNLTGVVQLAFYLADRGIKNIVLITDVSGLIPYRDHPVNSIAAAGQIMLVKTLSKIFAPRVLANAIAINAISAPFPGYTEKLPMKRLPEIDEIIRLVEFLAYENTYMTGEVLKLDGGRSLI